MMKKLYKTPEIEIKEFEIATEITLSLNNSPVDFENNPGDSDRIFQLVCGEDSVFVKVNCTLSCMKFYG